MNMCWDGRLEGSETETVAVYNTFVKNIRALWSPNFGKFPQDVYLSEADEWLELEQVWKLRITYPLCHRKKCGDGCFIAPLATLE